MSCRCGWSAACRRARSFRSTCQRPCLRRPEPPFRRANGPTGRRLADAAGRVRAGGGQMVQSRQGLWLRQSQAARRRTSSCIWRRFGCAGLGDLQPGQRLEARIAARAEGTDRGRAARAALIARGRGAGAGRDARGLQPQPIDVRCAARTIARRARAGAADDPTPGHARTASRSRWRGRRRSRRRA